MDDRIIEKYLEPVRKAINNVPHVVSLEVTTRCQLNCVYCPRDNSRPQNLSLEKLSLLKEQLPGVQRIIICGAGESFCYPNIYKALRILKEFHISIITNGAVPIDFLKLTADNIDLVVFSIDATTPEKIRKICKNYDFEILLRNLVNFWKFPKINRIINATINQHNIDELTNLIRFAARYRMQAVNYELPIGGYQFVKENRHHIFQKIEEANKTAVKCKVTLNEFFRLPCNSGGSVFPIIRLNGDVYPCCYGMYAGKSIGNIYKNNIHKIWNKEVKSFLSEVLCYQCEQVKNLLTVSLLASAETTKKAECHWQL